MLKHLCIYSMCSYNEGLISFMGRAALACSMVNTCDNMMIIIGERMAHVIQVCYTCESALLRKRSISTEMLNQNPILTAGIYYVLRHSHKI